MPQGKFVGRRKQKATPGSGMSSIVQGAENYGRKIAGEAKGFGEGLMGGISGAANSLPPMMDYNSMNAGAKGIKRVARRMGNLNR